MIASVLTLSRADCKALRITDPYSLHRVVYSLFPQKDGQSRSFLFADKGGDFSSRRILIVSEDKPLTPEIGHVQSKIIQDSFLDHNLYGFEVLVNPVKRNSKTGKLTAIKGKAELSDWFIQKAPSFGFFVYPDSLMVSDTDVLQFKKENSIVTFGKAKFTGKLEVTNRPLFKKSFCTGIGKAKGFGFGLLQIVPLTEASVDA